MLAASIKDEKHLPLAIRLPYPTGGHCDDACNWTADSLHTTDIVRADANSALLRHSLDSTTYYIDLARSGNASLRQDGRNQLTLTPADNEWTVTATFLPDVPQDAAPTVAQTRDASSTYWKDLPDQGAEWLTSATAPTRAPRNSNAAWCSRNTSSPSSVQAPPLPRKPASPTTHGSENSTWK